MNSNLISLIILAVSFLGLVFLVFKKIPALAALSGETSPVGENGFFSKIKNGVKNAPGIKSFSPEIFLQKIISQIRVLSLRADHKTANWLKQLREKTQQKKLDDGDYWQDLKNSKDKFPRSGK
jgi:hypothetical protein